MNHYDIKAPLTSYYEHNRKKKGQHLLKLLGEGKRIALVSDAGTPGVSDPGHELIRDCIGLGIPVVSLPGPTAVMTALVASGLPTDRFFFQGFLPKAPGKRKDLLEELKYQQGTIVLYASPHGLAGLLEDCRGVLGDRRAVIARELTKRYEEYIRGTLDGLLDWAKKSKIKGEFVLMLEGASGPGRKGIPHGSTWISENTLTGIWKRACPKGGHCGNRETAESPESLCTRSIEKIAVLRLFLTVTTTTLHSSVHQRSPGKCFSLVASYVSCIATEYAGWFILLQNYMLPSTYISKASFSAILRVLLNSIGITTLPSSSTFLTMPVDFIVFAPFVIQIYFDNIFT